MKSSSAGRAVKAAARPAQPAILSAGRPWPLGVEWIEAGNAFNFALYSRHATGVTLLGYNEPILPTDEDYAGIEMP
jgi:glycogen operon protein